MDEEDGISSGQYLRSLSMNPPNAHVSRDRLVIALDFGTTYSGIAYAFVGRQNPDVKSIMDWPGLEGKSQPKVPTVICYDPKDRTKFTWGGQKHKTEAIHGVKLLLDPDQPRPIYLPELATSSVVEDLGLSAIDVAADFISAMYEHALSRIKTKVPKEYYSMCQKQFVLSVPAVWSDRAKDATKKAAKQAGIYPITLIKEPEAAAMYTLHVLQDKALAIGDAFVVCDAGGGTVDLISYEIVSLRPKLELKELVPGKGGMAGSLGLNRRFEAAVKDLVGEDQYYHLRKTKGFRMAVDQFDSSIKTAFRGNTEEEYFLNFPMANLKDNLSRNLKSNTWKMIRSDVKKIFDPLIRDIERLVDEQVNLVLLKRAQAGHSKSKEIKAIFLVGGFGSSEYLKLRLEELRPNIQVIQPHGAWPAVVKGAVLSKLPKQATIISTQAPRHYGVAAMWVYDANLDKGRPRTFQPWTGEAFTEKMTWYINCGDDLKRDQRLRFAFYRTLNDYYGPEDLIFQDCLLQSERKIPPTYPGPGATEINCVLRVDLNNVDHSNFKKVYGDDGNIYWDIHYDLIVEMKSAIMTFSMEVQGKRMGSVEAHYRK